MTTPQLRKQIEEIIGDFSEALRLAETGFDATKEIDPSFKETTNKLTTLLQSQIEEEVEGFAEKVKQALENQREEHGGSWETLHRYKEAVDQALQKRKQ